MVNFDKSEVAFSRNVNEPVKDNVRSSLGVRIVSNHSKYLGLPVVIGRSNREIFAMVIERV